MPHVETIKKITSTELVAGEEGFMWAHLEVVTMGNVRKVIRVPYLYAIGLRVQLECQIDNMEPEVRKASWQACVAWVKRGFK
ncbi:hypothetical protein [Streptomyces sp. NBC_01500]|uniref:hypothetical protein n=1 Tax=Streptomyces sp. NBC_01500 TaxID=2903886 RepID=UPI002257D342|nr:hypothetical protein [Streptomyces sp. NBC_01500]MCX4554178.1 hypothetical protein [Streptomyces sp. NBC_01500]MCX4554518.1 hypothetical protein [Streptomyces sp. NBC_01500]